MKRYRIVVCGGVLSLASWLATDANSQAAAALTTVAAAKAAVAPKTPNAKPWHVYHNLFNELCTEDRSIDAMRPAAPQGKLLPRADWYYPPHKFFVNLYFIGTKTA